MSKQHHHSEHEHKGEHHSPRKGIHRRWWFWVTLIPVILMLAAMFMYVASQDEAVQPGGKAGPPVPADAE